MILPPFSKTLVVVGPFVLRHLICTHSEESSSHLQVWWYFLTRRVENVNQLPPCSKTRVVLGTFVLNHIISSYFEESSSHLPQVQWYFLNRSVEDVNQLPHSSQNTGGVGPFVLKVVVSVGLMPSWCFEDSPFLPPVSTLFIITIPRRVWEQHSVGWKILRSRRDQLWTCQRTWQLLSFHISKIFRQRSPLIITPSPWKVYTLSLILQCYCMLTSNQLDSCWRCFIQNIYDLVERMTSGIEVMGSSSVGGAKKLIKSFSISNSQPRFLRCLRDLSVLIDALHTLCDHLIWTGSA